ncbi:MAG: ATP-binding protein [Candidatus Zixiibacteriota bacterium]
MFTSKLEEINFERIKRFCEEQNPEGEIIEYKGGFPSNLEKSISAMANTYGGIILIGVEADKIKNTPIMPIKGINPIEGSVETVTSICLKRISPPYFPSIIKVCDFKSEKGEDKIVVFMKVDESHQTPHAINNNTDVYFRIKSQNEPFRKATIDEIDWLKNRRQKAVENRESLMERADQRFLSMPFNQEAFLPIRERDKDLYSSYRKASIIPLFPSRTLLEYSELLDLRNTYYDSHDPVFYLNKPMSCAGSLCFPEVSNRLSYTEFNIFGLVYNKQGLWENSDPKTKELFDVSYFLTHIYRTVSVSLAIYEKAGYYGSILIDVQVGGILGKRICVVENYRERHPWCTNRIEPNIHIRKISCVAELNENLESLVIEICKDFLWSCGVTEEMRDESQTIKILKNLYNIAKTSFQ